MAPDLDRLHNNIRARLYIKMADKYLDTIGYTEHGLRHTDIVSKTAYDIMKKLSYNEKDTELAAAAGFLHDIGNMLGRQNHQNLGAILAKEVLEELGYELEDIVKIMMAIAIHEEDGAEIPDVISAALVIADKADVHRSRVRNPKMVSEDIHDRVNYAATESKLKVDPDKKLIVLSLVIDTKISQVIEYFAIFLTRMMACKKAAGVLGCEFELFINNTRMA
ncbi:MAG: HD domain-containing protein [Nitrospiraceae bacterium]|nr:HD domain-containing protein [Nitrospiraceae bacterium]